MTSSAEGAGARNGGAPAAAPELKATTFDVLLADLRDAHEAELKALRAQLARAELELASRAKDPILSNSNGIPATSPAQSPAIVDSTPSKEAVLPPTSAASSPKAPLKRDGSEFSATVTKTATTSRDSGSQQKKLSVLTPREEQVLDSDANVLTRLVASKTFEILFCAVIILHAVVMAIEAQWDGGILGQEVGFYEGAPPKRSVGEAAFYAWNWIFGILYLAELTMKVLGMGKEWTKSAWNWFDLFLVIMWIWGIIQESARIETGATLNFQMIRLIRLARLFRLIRLVRSISVFDDLYLITTALKGSFRVLGWTIVVFSVIQVTLAICLSQVLYIYISNPSKPLDERQEVFEYFGTFGRSILTCFEITLGNWVPPSRLLTENVSEWWMAFGIMHKLTAGFALVGVINGVFIQETFKVVASDDTIMVRRKKAAADLHQKKMSDLFESAQADEPNAEGEYYITKDGYNLIMSDPEVKTWLDSMELETRDLDRLFRLLDTGGDNCDGTITLDELVDGVARLKGAARSIDVVAITRQLDSLATEIKNINDSMVAFKPSTEAQDFTL